MDTKNTNELIEEYMNSQMKVKDLCDKYNISICKLYKTINSNNVNKIERRRVIRKPHIWTEEKIRDESKKHRHRSDWLRYSPGSYIRARKINILDECCSHMEYKTNCFNSNIGIVYAFVFSDNSVYIGLTVSPKRRFRYHKKNGPIADKITVGTSYEIQFLEKEIPNDKLSEREIFWIEKYKNENYNLININKGGSRGAIYRHISNEEIKKVALKYKTRNEWAKSIDRKFYSIAVSRKMLDSCCAHMTSPYIFWTTETVLAEAQKFNTIHEWQKASGASYNFANKQKIIGEATKHMKKCHETWTKEKLLIVTTKYNSIAEWIKNDKRSYSAAKRLKVFEECSKHMHRTHKQWAKEDIISFAQKFDTITKWINASSHSFRLAKKFGIVETCVQHMNAGNKTNAKYKQQNK